MKFKFIVFVVVFTISANSFGQQSPTWDKWNWLLGEWEGEGSGQPGEAKGTFSFTFDLDSKVLLRKSHTEFPEQNDKPKLIHQDLMVIHLDNTQAPAKAVYFDNEGHTIYYLVSYTEDSILLTSENKTKGPVFRLTYTLLDTNSIYTKFEISSDGNQFRTYVEGKSKKAN